MDTKQKRAIYTLNLLEEDLLKLLNGKIPSDLKLTLDEIYNYIVMYKKN